MKDTTYAICNECLKVNRVPLAGIAGKAPVCGACKHTLDFHDGVSELTSAALVAFVEKSPVPIVADFWASWCGPCRMFAPTFLAAAGQLGTQAAFVKVNTEIHPDAATRHNIRGIPALLLFAQGKEIAREAGALPLPDFVNWLKSALPRKKAA